MSLSPAFLDELRARTSLSALIAQTTKLQKAGREMRGCCPFHNEKTPSFYVNDDKGFYHCFGCSAHGDAIRWMTDQRGLPFIDAVRELAQAAGMELPAIDRQSAEKAERARGLHEAMADAERWFRDQLAGLGGAEARGLIDRRGISAEIARAFGLGFAPDARGRLKAALADYGDPMLVEAGLLIQVDGKDPYDRFRGRVTIPIRDARGRVIAFGARIVGEGEPKYLNSPDTPLFDKGRTLYNLDRALPAARKVARVIVVEGYLDVIALAQAGIAEVVAPLGTALTESQLERLWGIADVPLVCLDGDAAGQKAALRAAHRALPLLAPGQSLSFAVLPPGQDPDDVIQAGGAAAFEALLDRPTPLLHTLYSDQKAQALTDTPEGRAKLEQGLSDLAATIRNDRVRKQYDRAFRDLFYEEFGWRRAERSVIGRSIVETGPRRKVNVFRLMIRSVLYGLVRFPEVIPDAVDQLYEVRLDDDDLKLWRDQIGDASIRHPRVDKDAVVSIFAMDHPRGALAADLRSDLRFHWNIDSTVAVRRLRGLVDVVRTEQEIDLRMGELNAELMGSTGLARYDDIENERAGLRRLKLELYETAYVLGEDVPLQDVG